MKYELQIRPSADADVDAAADYIARDSLDAALRFYDAVDLTYQQLRDHPKRWRPYGLDLPVLPAYENARLPASVSILSLISSTARSLGSSASYTAPAIFPRH